MGIPKIIHYCWFGPKPIPEVEQKCMKSWKKYLPDYELMFWNEKTFDVHSNTFVKQAHEAKHYAFVSDYVRTKVLYEYGGLYLDTDVEILENFNNILKNEKCFIGFETRAKMGTAVMCFTPNHVIIKEFIKYYLNNNFKNNKGEINTIANVTILTDILIKHGLKIGGFKQLIADVKVFPREYFYPKKITENEFKITSQTIAIHRCSNSWMTERERTRGKNKIWINIMRPLLRSIRGLGINIIGEARIQRIEIKIRNILK